MVRDKTLLPETRYTRRVTWRRDEYGMYLLFWQRDSMLAGITYQYHKHSEWLVTGLSVFSWEPMPDDYYDYPSYNEAENYCERWVE